jgi:flavin-dependent dehydrogenase
MKVAIAGAGIAGGYLARLLEQKGLSPDIYDGIEHETNCGFRSCGWGAPWDIGKYLEDIGLDLNEYLIEPMSLMNFDGLVAKTPLYTINKPRLIRDVASGTRLRKQNLEEGENDAYDVVVDATGIARAFLPPCRSDLTLPTLQHRARVESRGNQRFEAGVHGNRIPGLGYLWIFPLGNSLYHIGVGGIGLVEHDRILEQFYREAQDQFMFTKLCGCTGAVRVASPFYSTPFTLVMDRSDGCQQTVVGVGESIGTVSPFTGEGIVYSLECARLLADSWPDFEGYTRKVLSRFAWMKKERETLDFLLAQGKGGGPRMRDRWRFYRNAHRSGIRLPMIEAFRRMGSLSMWVEGPDSK